MLMATWPFQGKKPRFLPTWTEHPWQPPWSPALPGLSKGKVNIQVLFDPGHHSKQRLLIRLIT